MNTESLLVADRHVLHPLHHPSDHASPLMLVEGEGVMLRDASGRQYLDACAGLWNVLVGYGRKELARAAADQMERLAYCSAYAGFANAPSAELAARLAGMAAPDLNTTFFASGGAEANE